METNLKFYVSITIVVGALLGVFFIGKTDQAPPSWHRNTTGHEHQLTVYKSPTCGCCTNYVGYIRFRGYKVDVVDTEGMDAIKEQFGIPHEMLSCHTTVVNDGEYFIEGHIPEEAVAKILEEEPRIKGIGMPGMPHGSPGMPGIPETPFEILQLDNDHGLGVYVTI